MHQLSPFTCRRLSQLPRLTSVWECDRRPLPMVPRAVGDDDEPLKGDCILWVDSLQGVVRGMNVVPTETGHEAIVRTLLQAIEAPQGQVDPARPRKVVVCDREIQFFLRGALQSLDIPVEHASELPVIDEIFEKIQSAVPAQVEIPPSFQEILLMKAATLWQDQPWTAFNEQEILAIELNRWEIETLYLSILGMAGVEFGLLFYRDLDSLRQFRHKLLNSNDKQEAMQQAFLEQNCLFVNFSPIEGVVPLSRMTASGLPAAAVDYDFGSVHPLEGLRSQLAEEEAASLVVALEALHRFFKKHNVHTKDFSLQPVSSRFRITDPTRLEEGKKELVPVKVSTLPEVSAAFLTETTRSGSLVDLSADLDREFGDFLNSANAAIVDDSVPEGSLIILGHYKTKELEQLKAHHPIYYQDFLTCPKRQPSTRAKWPVLTIQTTRPKAKQLVEQFKQEGGIQAICFNPGHDPTSGQVFQIGLIQTAVGALHLFNEYEISDLTDSQAIEKWMLNSDNNHSCCGCIIAAGASGMKRGRPTIKETVAFFEVLTKQPEELGLMPLVMSYAPDW
ncbi:hypothetical protein S7335_3422 [Synechococcus sp. PCC 7335]|uniref:DUF6930 domain-containing protein n=1 Tax=Synechococcus sp. (strain ATCC 29403 / PCC 7335) TaxID=91464 RepID=UPI00017EB81D|nr:hypothetical protein [Synechococcus sp. PCC 7335]EDX85719.1 hypothetical protein S7335_3422 [Synechococcus sp. PCC 7335]